jgi:hypothetical protein
MKLLFQDGDLELELLLQGVKPCLKNKCSCSQKTKQSSKCVKIRAVCSFLEDQELEIA